ncbi:hypothetical protein HUU53_01875 [Candidatus Micrarchaeota archaeon]|nr:hypothetical protein [Candidatus Micrarchaeota archaeon]
MNWLIQARSIAVTTPTSMPQATNYPYIQQIPLPVIALTILVIIGLAIIYLKKKN